MNKKIKVMWILIILMWLCWLSAVIVNKFSNIAYWILLGCWAMFVIAIIINIILMGIDLKRQERKYEISKEHLEELIKRYLILSLNNENDNQDKE